MSAPGGSAWICGLTISSGEGEGKKGRGFSRWRSVRWQGSDGFRLHLVRFARGDRTRLPPKLRLGEIDLFVGRLEPGHAAPDLVTEKLLAVFVEALSR